MLRYKRTKILLITPPRGSPLGDAIEAEAAHKDGLSIPTEHTNKKLGGLKKISILNLLQLIE
jgi:hypothetical protein